MLLHALLTFYPKTFQQTLVISIGFTVVPDRWLWNIIVFAIISFILLFYLVNALTFNSLRQNSLPIATLPPMVRHVRTHCAHADSRIRILLWTYVHLTNAAELLEQIMSVT